MPEGLKAHSPRQDGTEVSDKQIRIGSLKEYGQMEVNREDFIEGRGDKPDLKDHFIDPVTPKTDYSEDVGFDPMVRIRKQADKAYALATIDGVIQYIYKESPELGMIDAIDIFLKSHHVEETEINDIDKMEDVKKTNIPYEKPQEDSVAELSSTERHETEG